LFEEGDLKRGSGIMREFTARIPAAREMIIELLRKLHDFLQLKEKELDEVRISREVLSNSILPDGNF
jgi:hypothetical protein